ncbi:MAG: hypothetical protein J6Y24_03210 [Bacteroidales bacterium]|nr:hypothetical protein [Bacteroidales bacterium]
MSAHELQLTVIDQIKSLNLNNTFDFKLLKSILGILDTFRLQKTETEAEAAKNSSKAKEITFKRPQTHSAEVTNFLKEIDLGITLPQDLDEKNAIADYLNEKYK